MVKDDACLFIAGVYLDNDVRYSCTPPDKKTLQAAVKRALHVHMPKKAGHGQTQQLVGRMVGTSFF